MIDDIHDWQRPHFRAGGGDAFLFYVMFGPIPSDFTISRGDYHFDGIPDGVQLTGYNPNTHPEVLDNLREGFLWEQLQNDDPALATVIGEQTEGLKLIGPVQDPVDLNYFRNVVGLIQWLFDQGGVGLYDPFRFFWWTPDQWRRDAFESESGSPRQHVVTLVSEDDDGEWIHTRGLRKFGRPDLSVHKVPREHRDAIFDMLNRFIEFQALGGVIDEGQEIRMDTLPGGMTCHHGGDVDDPDFNNVHVEITWADN